MELKPGDTIKCSDKVELVNMLCELATQDIECDFHYEKDGVKGLWLEVISVSRTFEIKDYEDLSHWAKVARGDMGLSQVEIARAIDYGDEAVGKIERQQANPTLGLVFALTRGTGYKIIFEKEEK